MTDFYLKTVTVKNNFGGIQGAIIEDLEKALYLEAELIMTTSKRDYVPVVSGNLRNSGTVKRPVRSGDKIEIELGYGGSAAPYAAIVHEYPKNVGQGKNKYLSQPLNVSAKNMAARIAKHIRNAINKRGRGR